MFWVTDKQETWWKYKKTGEIRIEICKYRKKSYFNQTFITFKVDMKDYGRMTTRPKRLTKDLFRFKL